jgi:hypothetical protein
LPAISFDPSSGQLAVRTDGGNHTIREGVTADGFMDVTLDGQHHSSNPSSASFDGALAGATGSTVAGIRFAGTGQDTLVLGSQHLAGGLTVQAAGASVVTEDMVSAGPVAIQAPHITVSGALHGSTVSLAASGWVDVQAAGRINAGPSQGSIGVAASVFVNAGQVRADGQTGGQVNIQAGKVLNAGPITADSAGPGTHGGQVHIAFSNAYIATTAASVSASSTAGPGGSITIDGGNTGRLYSSGQHLATGTVGGGIDLFGRDVILAGATVSASGLSGGGGVRIGGDFHGYNPAVINAQTVTVTPATTIQANALSSGSGGRLFVGANHITEFAGVVSARGGSAGGPGGLIEVSGRGDVNYSGSADAGAPLGTHGTLLLDPKNITVSDHGALAQFNLIDPNPTTDHSLGLGFGSLVSVLSNGKVVVTNPNDNFGGTWAGAAYLFDGSSGALISTLVGSHDYDRVSYFGVTPLSNGNYLIKSTSWNNSRGAVTWGDGTKGVSGTVAGANSLVGSNQYDDVGYFSNGVTALSNGNYVIQSPYWNTSRGAVTWGDGTKGVQGTISAANSLVGSNPYSSNPYNPGDQVGRSVTPLNNGNYVVASPAWNYYRGAVTWVDGSTAVHGEVSAANSLVGSNQYDEVGSGGYAPGVIALNNGNFVVDSPFWQAQSSSGYLIYSAGAVTWGNGTTGVQGSISADNSLVGTNYYDEVGYYGITALSDGNYVVDSPFWHNTSSFGYLIYGAGAVTWCNGSAVTNGAVSSSNSLVGDSYSDEVGLAYNDARGYYNGIAPLNDGNYVVASPYWHNRSGAVTWVNGSAGVTGPISSGNSLVGSKFGDQVGYGSFTGLPGVTVLSNGNYVVDSVKWNGDRGAVTWQNGSTGIGSTGVIGGAVSADNSLVGSYRDDQVGGELAPLGGDNGNYVVGSRTGTTWVSGTSGETADGSGLVTINNSLIGGGDVTPLKNGNYVVISSYGGRGAVTWADGNTGIAGTISDANSLVGGNPGDLLGDNGATPLSNGNYVVISSYGGRGAATWEDGSKAVTGTITISDANSLVGSTPGDMVGSVQYYPQGPILSDVTLLSDGNYVVSSPNWNDGRGAATLLSSTTGQTLDGKGVITAENSLLGQTANAGLRDVVVDPIHDSFICPFVLEGGGRVTVGGPYPNQLNVSLTPDSLTATLNTGTAVVLQASNDITVNSPITVSAGGQSGALTLQAGRSILLNASITTDNGALNLIANDQLANGVVDSQRDPGKAVIAMAAGTILNTGSGAVAVELRDGDGLTNRDSGAITLQSVTAGSVSILNNGPSAGSDVNLGTVITSGAQSYSSPNGATTVTGNISAPGSPVTFLGTVDFAGSGTQILQTGSGSSFVNLKHSGAGTLQLAGSLIVTGTFSNTAGTFDANDQTVTVAGQATLASGTYLAGTALQTFSRGLSITGGAFTSSSGPMTVSGGITMSSGLLSGIGTVDAVTTVGGTVEPGTSASPGLLTISGAAVFTPGASVAILLNGTDTITGYAQLQAGGPIVLAGSTLNLTVGFQPPVGSTFEILTNTGSIPISGTFNGLDEGAVFTQGGYQFQITYHGGTGNNSVVLTRLA